MEKLLKQRVEILAQEVEKMKAGGAGEGYTKAEADAKFLSKTDASTDYQTKIADLSTIRSGAAAGATAVQPIELVDIVNDGAKNIIPLPYSEMSRTQRGVVYQSDNYGVLHVTGACDGTGNSYFPFIGADDLKKIIKSGVEYVLYAKITGVAAISDIYLNANVSGTATTIVNLGNMVAGEYSQSFTYTITEGYRGVSLGLKIANTITQTQDCYISIMICEKSKFDISHTVVPYGLSNADLTSNLIALTNETVIKSTSIANADLNGIAETGFALYTTPTNMPADTSGNAFVRTSVYDTNTALQELTLAATGASYIRVKAAGTWGTWTQTTNT